METDDLASQAGAPELRRLRLRYAGACVLCGRFLEKESEALYDPVARTVRCVECEPNDSRATINTGSAGASAHREYERRRIAREVRVKAQLGNVIGGFALALTGEPRFTRAWERGSVGERKLAEALAGVEGLVALHDRRAPKTRGNIDHIVIAPAGVFVVDAKRYAGLIQIRYRGGLFSRDERLYSRKARLFRPRHQFGLADRGRPTSARRGERRAVGRPSDSRAVFRRRRVATPPAA